MAIRKNRTVTVNSSSLSLSTVKQAVDSQKLLIESLSISAVPLDINSLVEHHGIKIIYEDMDDTVRGYIEKRTQGWYICVNRTDGIYRQRFTIAHELGHYLLHFVAEEVGFSHHDSDSVMWRDENASSGVDPKEVQANQFASELLIPRDALDYYISKGVCNLNDLSQEFHTSKISMQYRLDHLRISYS